MFLMPVDRSATKNEIRDALLNLAAEAVQDLSPAKADKLANKFKKGLFDPILKSLLTYQDPTGDTATTNLMEAAA